MHFDPCRWVTRKEAMESGVNVRAIEDRLADAREMERTRWLEWLGRSRAEWNELHDRLEGAVRGTERTEVAMEVVKDLTDRDDKLGVLIRRTARMYNAACDTVARIGRASYRQGP